MGQPVLHIDQLNLEFPGFRSSAKALNGVSLSVAPGEIVGVVGESGSGKSVTAMLTLGLLPRDSYRVTGGRVTLVGHDMLALSERQLMAVRGREAAMIFQEPMTALNPTRRIGRQLLDVIRRHTPLDTAQARARAIELLKDMHIADPEQILERYPFELSGGMRQRIMIALAFSCDPQLLIADEPTTALDVTVQRQVLLLLREKARARGTAILLITHDMALVAQFCDRVYVMYAGGIVEQGATAAVMQAPRHPYTQGLLACLPEKAVPASDLASIPGQVPNLAQLPSGCSFKERCGRRHERCETRPGLLSTDTPDHLSACWLQAEDALA